MISKKKNIIKIITTTRGDKNQNKITCFFCEGTAHSMARN